MLNPDTRETLLEALRPPPGYGLGCAVGTSFSLSLDAALTAPAAFAIYAISDQDQSSAAEALELLESIRRHADRFTIFYQAGQASVPRQRRLFAFLEQAIVPVTAPLSGVFHPKVWALRFDAPDAEPTYRALIASRNLTYDRSWDVILRLDAKSEDVEDDGSSFDGVPLADFVAALPGLAVLPVGIERREEIERLASELRTVRWALPDGVADGRFHVLGLEAATSLPFPQEAERMAVISPFLSSGLLHRLPPVSGRSVLVSRPDELRASGKGACTRFDERYVLDGDAMPVQEAELDTPASLSTDDPGIPLEGLHAKVYVFDQGKRTKVFCGSANATLAAFEKNVEFLAELCGDVKALGVEAMMALPASERQTLLSFLQPFDIEPVDEAEPVPPEEAVLDELRRAIAATGFIARAIDTTEGGLYRLSFAPDKTLPAVPNDVEWRVWPITLARDLGRPAQSSGVFDAEFAVSFEGITAFLANELSLGSCSTCFVTTAQLVEAPANHANRLLGLMIGDASRFLRFLLMLLADDALDRYGLSALLETAEEPGGWRKRSDDLPLLEAMLRTLARDPERLEHIERLIRDLESEPEGRELLPDGLLDIWAPIQEAARRLTR